MYQTTSTDNCASINAGSILVYLANYSTHSIDLEHLALLINYYSLMVTQTQPELEANQVQHQYKCDTGQSINLVINITGCL